VHAAALVSLPELKGIWMPSYQAPVEDWLFILNDFLRVGDRHDLPGYAELTSDFCAQILREAARFHEEVVFPIGVKADAEAARLVDGKVATPSGFKELWRAYREAGWMSLGLPEAIGGAGLPPILSSIVGEMRGTTAHSFSMYVGFCPSAARMLAALGEPWMKDHVVSKLVTGEWTATMCLTESHCGTDLRQIRTRATPQDDGSWRIDGTKIFISGGDHDLTENVIHVVLAKIPDAQGVVRNDVGDVNVFLVSKLALNPEDGSLAGSNGVTVGSIEHKMGIEGNATCVMNFEGARAWRIADVNATGTAANMAAMFLLMNYARIGTATSGVGYAEISGQNARAYARERLVGRSADGSLYPELPGDPLIVHPDIRRLLLGPRAFAEGGRATALRVALWQAEAEGSVDPGRRAASADLLELLTPVMKAYFTDKGFEAANDSLQVLGGHGYIREYGLEQMVRNARIGQIYEGANGVQAIDLVQRKLPARGWRAPATFLAELDLFIAAQRGVEGMDGFINALADARLRLAGIFSLLRQRAASNPEANLAVAYDILEACGIVTVGWTWAAIAAVLQQRGNHPMEFKHRKLTLAKFWFEREMPKILTLQHRIAVERPAVLDLLDQEV
jgi:alkylation response protein AidB-like acyl-CoA dehydrogenase